MIFPRREQVMSIVRDFNKRGKVKNSTELDNFLNEYGSLTFDNVKFRPGSAFTADFGLDNVFNEFRFHTAVDRNAGSNPVIYAPFELERIEVFTGAMEMLGIQLRLHTKYGFEIRIAHIEEIPEETQRKIDNKEGFSCGEYICKPGNAGKSTGVHTHVEVVSYDEDCFLLEEILFLKFPDYRYSNYTIRDVAIYLGSHGFKEDPEAAFNREMKKKRIETISNYSCKRIDYHTNKKATFYSSKALFNM